jgi:hypothetical protein
MVRQRRDRQLEHISFGLNRADSQSCIDERFWQH